MRKLWKKVLVLIIIVALNIDMISVPIYAQKDAETESEYVETNEIEEAVVENNEDSSIVTIESGEWDKVTT